jgi:hypothetical protein
MAGIYIRKDVSEQSRWGSELLVHGGQDAKDFGFGVNLPRLPGSNALRHFGRANVSYLAPVGNGLTLQAGIFNSFIGMNRSTRRKPQSYARMECRLFPILDDGCERPRSVQRSMGRRLLRHH